MEEWAKGVPVDRVWFVSSLLLRIQERGACRLIKAQDKSAPEHAVAPVEMRLAMTFLMRAGYGLADVIDEGDTWLVTPWQVEA
jgi:hypothetical protein